MRSKLSTINGLEKELFSINYVTEDKKTASEAIVIPLSAFDFLGKY